MNRQDAKSADTFGHELSGMDGRERICGLRQTINLLGVLGVLAVFNSH